MIMTVQPGAIETGSADEEGCLVLADGRLVAVMVRLSDRHGDMAGRWYLEHGFGRLDGPTHPTFSTVNEASDWIARRLCERDQNPSTPRV